MYTKQPPVSESYYHSLEFKQKGELQILRIKACIFADRFLAPQFARAMRHCMIFRIIHCESVKWPTVIYVFENLPEDDRLLQLLVDTQCFEADIEADFEKDLPRSFMLRAMRTYEKWRDLGGEIPRPKDCDYHGHTSEEEERVCNAQVQKQLSE